MAETYSEEPWCYSRHVDFLASIGVRREGSQSGEERLVSRSVSLEWYRVCDGVVSSIVCIDRPSAVELDEDPRSVNSMIYDIMMRWSLTLNAPCIAVPNEAYSVVGSMKKAGANCTAFDPVSSGWSTNSDDHPARALPPHAL
jgi:hypothetical protein